MECGNQKAARNADRFLNIAVLDISLIPVAVAVDSIVLAQDKTPMLSTIPNSFDKEASAWVCELGTATLFSTRRAKMFFVGS
jgi:hypothetical protein